MAATLAKALAEAVFIAAAPILGYLAIRLLLPLLTFGKWQVKPLSRPERSARAWVDRQARRAGTRFVSPEVAAIAGSVLLCALLVATIERWHWLP